MPAVPRTRGGDPFRKAGSESPRQDGAGEPHPGQGGEIREVRSGMSHLLWENFRTTVLIRGESRVHRVAGSPVIDIFADGISNRIGIRIETDPLLPIPPDLAKLAFITTNR